MGDEFATPDTEVETAPAALKDDGRERLTSADGRLTFTLHTVPADAGFQQEAVDGYQRLRSELAAVVEGKNEQVGQTSADQADQLARWRRTYKTVNRMEPFRPLPSLRLTRREDTLGLTPAEYGLGSWVTWRDEQSGQQVTGQVMAPGPAGNTWYVSTDRTGHTGEYHVLSRSGKKTTGYSYSVNGAAADLQPADGPGPQRPLEDLPEADSIPARPVQSYADYVPGGILARVREPIPVTVGEVGPRFDPAEVAFDVTADGIPFVVKLDRDDDSGAETFQPRIEGDGEMLVLLAPLESKGEAIDRCVQLARDARENVDKPLYAHHRNNDFALAVDGVCGRCSLHAGDNEVQKLHRVNGGDPQCLDHVASSFGVSRDDLVMLALARRIWAIRVAPESAAADPAGPPASVKQSAEQQLEGFVVQETAAAAASQDLHDVERATVRPGDLITFTAGSARIEWPTALEQSVPETVVVTGTLPPGFRDYHDSTNLLDVVIHDPDGAELVAVEDVLVRHLPSRVRLIPAGHRDDLRPEPRTAGQIRLGDLVAEGGIRGEVVTEVGYTGDPRGATTFTTRDVKTRGWNGFSLANTYEVLVVPRERRQPQDVAAAFGRHGSHAQAAAETARTHALHTALTEGASRQWPDGDGPQDELQALRDAIQTIDAPGRGADAYRANAAAMSAAAAAAAALFEAADDTARYGGYTGESLHELRQHLDIQAHRLHADIARLAQRTAAAPLADASTGSAADEMPVQSGGEEHPVSEEQPPAREEETAIASQTSSDPESVAEQLGLFGAGEANAERSAPPADAPGPEPTPEPDVTESRPEPTQPASVDAGTSPEAQLAEQEEAAVPNPDESPGTTPEAQTTAPAGDEDTTDAALADAEPPDTTVSPPPAEATEGGETLPVEDPPVPDWYDEELAGTPAVTDGTDETPSPPEALAAQAQTAAPDRTEETLMATPTEPGERLQAAAESAMTRESQTGARPEPPAEERGDSLQARAMTRAASAPSQEQQDVPLWTGTDLSSGSWREEDGVLYDAYGAPQWRLKTAPGAEPPATSDDDSPAPDGDAYEPVGIKEAFTSTVAEAWADVVPPEHGTVEDLLEAVDMPLQKLEEQWQRAVPAPRTDGESQAASARADQGDPASPQRDPEPVNEALRQADTHAAALKDLPEWQRLQTVRGATAHLWNVLREKAGTYFEQLSKDIRVQGFWRTVSIRTTAAIATGAQKLANVALRGRRGGDLPTAEALLNLSDAALTYSTPGIPRPDNPDPSTELADNVVEVRQLTTTLRDGAPVPYGTREEAAQASREVAEAFQTWRETSMGQELTTASEHPRVAAFRQAWQRLPSADLPDGPGTAAGPYGDVGRTAQQLVERAAAANAQHAQAGQPPRFAEGDVEALRALATLAEHHGGRLAVTLPPGLTGPAPAPRAAAPRPRVAAPVAPAGSRGMSA
ncbi:hypothetical protein ACIPSA_47480 [Streptomyces sp. NPDC086549]|uniref:hypothetical protein n=1 Tax=Streptomyces sp. NPDC086549 TaxID=3365752 RepID=UPI00380A7610